MNNFKGRERIVGKPYIGITGFMKATEVFNLVKLIPTRSRRLLMVGVLASSKTLRGVKNKWPNRYPKVENIRNIFIDHFSVMNLIHYNTKEKGTLLEQLRALTKISGANLDGFQLNITWPSPVVLEKYRSEFPAMTIILQIGNHAFKVIDHSPEQLVEKVEGYNGLADYILLDPSGGYGRPFDTEKASKYLYALKNRDMEIGFGVAGGLSKDSLHLIKPLLYKFRSLSMDAEGLLRDEKDNLNLKWAGAYVQGALELVSKVKINLNH